MKKRIGVYSVIWAICLVVFNVTVFVTPNKINGVSKFGGSFWVGYIFITAAFIGQLVCALFAFRAEDPKKFFYKIPLISVSYSGLILMLIAESVFMAVPALPKWLGIIVCVMILACNAIAIIKATAAAEVVGGMDEKVKTQTFFIKNLTVDAQSLMACAASDALRTETKRVYESIRYSDPRSNDALAELDARIQRQFNAFADAVKEEDVTLATEAANALLETVDRRNQKCKLLK